MTTIATTATRATPSVRIADIRYNPAERSFEALAIIHETGEVLTYALSLRAPIDTDFAAVTRLLTALAHRRHTRRTPDFVSRKPDPLAAFVPPAVREATQSLWSRMLKRAA